MLALALLAFVTALLWGTFAQTARVKKRIEQAQERTHTVRVALMRMSREIEMAFMADDTSGTQLRRTMFSGTSHGDFDELLFSWFGHQRLRADSPEGDTALVHYFTAPDPDDPMVTNLMRRETRRLEYKEPQMIPGETYLLCPAITRLKFAYYDSKAEGLARGLGHHQGRRPDLPAHPGPHLAHGARRARPARHLQQHRPLARSPRRELPPWCLTMLPSSIARAPLPPARRRLVADAASPPSRPQAARPAERRGLAGDHLRRSPC